MPRLAIHVRPRLPTNALEGGATTDRAVHYDGEGGADRRPIADTVLVGKDPLFPKFGGYQPVRASLSLFPSKNNKAQPALLSRINLLLKESALFDRELGAGYEAGEQQSEASRARLDVLRVAFAMYSEQATMYRPFLGMVQRVSCVICVLPCWPLRFRPYWCLLAIIVSPSRGGRNTKRTSAWERLRRPRCKLCKNIWPWATSIEQRRLRN
jgi:hypothetical protein